MAPTTFLDALVKHLEWQSPARAVAAPSHSSPRGLNNIQDSDYQNVVIQMLCTVVALAEHALALPGQCVEVIGNTMICPSEVIPIRNYFLGYQPPSEKKLDALDMAP